MADIVERLLKIAEASRREDGSLIPLGLEITEAAEEITDLRQLLSEAEKREKEAVPGWVFAEGDLVRKKSGSWWEGRVVGTYSTEQTPRGYAVQLDKPFGPVQIYPESALESALQSEGR